MDQVRHGFLESDVCQNKSQQSNCKEKEHIYSRYGNALKHHINPNLIGKFDIDHSEGHYQRLLKHVCACTYVSVWNSNTSFLHYLTVPENPLLTVFVLTILWLSWIVFMETTTTLQSSSCKEYIIFSVCIPFWESDACCNQFLSKLVW